MGLHPRGGRPQARLVVVGGGAVGAGAAARARRLDESAGIVLVERGPDIAYATCGLPYYLGDVIADRSDLFLHTPASFARRFNIDVRVEQELVSIDRAKKSVRLRTLRTGSVHEETYSKLVIATGARSFRPAVPGADLPGVFTVQTVPDADRVRKWTHGTSGRAVVVGAGFLGLETAENLRRLGLPVTLVERESHVLPSFDCEMTAPVLAELEELSVETVLGDGIVAIEGDGRVRTVVLESGGRIAADVVVLSLGVRPETDVAREAGLATGESGALIVTDYLQTSDDDIYAGGDAAEVIHRVTGLPAWVPLAGPAARQARVIGTNVTGGRDRFEGALGTAIVSVGSVVLAMTGLSEKAARAAGINHYVSYTVGPHHAEFFPGAHDLAIKLVVERPSGRLLGALVAGRDGVDKRVDVLATAIWSGMTVDDVAALDLSYAPPFSSARDPVVVAGMVAQNVRRATVVNARSVPPNGGAWLLDVRRPDELSAGHLDGALHIPVDELRERSAELDPEAPYVIYCQTGRRSYVACRILEGLGFARTENLSGGYGINSWRSLGCREA